MTNVRKALFGGIAAVIVVAAGGLWWLYASKDALVKAAIERFGPEITGVAVSVGAVKLEPVEGRGTISNLVVGNPKGYDAPHAMTLGEMRLVMEPASLTQDVVVIREVVLQAPEVTYQLSDGRSNLDVIQKHVEQYVAQHAGAKKEGAEAQKKFLVEHLYVRDGKVHLGTTAALPLPNVHLRDIGSKSGGATAGEVVKSTWSAILRGASNLASRVGTAIKEGAKSVIDGARSLLK